MIYPIEEEHLRQKFLYQATELVQRKKTRLRWNHIDLISAEIEDQTIEQLYCLATHLSQTCNRVIVLAMQSEFTHLIVTKSSDIAYLYVDEILETLSQDYGGQLSKDHTFGHAIFYQHGIVPELIDRTVESIVVAMPYEQ